MKVTMYELLGMVKDGKAPKKIKFNRIYCYYRECKNEYVDYTDNSIIQWDYVVMNSLNDKVEILEEEPKGIPEKIKLTNGGLTLHDNNNDYTLSVIHKCLINKINEIIDYLESKGE